MRWRKEAGGSHSRQNTKKRKRNKRRECAGGFRLYENIKEENNIQGEQQPPWRTSLPGVLSRSPAVHDSVFRTLYIYGDCPHFSTNRRGPSAQCSFTPDGTRHFCAFSFGRLQRVVRGQRPAASRARAAARDPHAVGSACGVYALNIGVTPPAPPYLSSPCARESSTACTFL